jgi:hypothetical protein
VLPNILHTGKDTSRLKSSDGPRHRRVFAGDRQSVIDAVVISGFAAIVVTLESVEPEPIAGYAMFSMPPHADMVMPSA